MTDNSVGQHLIILAVVYLALAVCLIIFNIFQPGFCCDTLCSFNQTC